MKPHIRILLGEAASKAMLDAGECFVIAGKASHPDDSSRIAVHFLPIDKETGDKLCGVLQGTHRITKIKQASPVDGGKEDGG